MSDLDAELLKFEAELASLEPAVAAEPDAAVSNTPTNSLSSSPPNAVASSMHQNGPTAGTKHSATPVISNKDATIPSFASSSTIPSFASSSISNAASPLTSSSAPASKVPLASHASARMTPSSLIRPRSLVKSAMISSQAQPSVSLTQTSAASTKASKASTSRIPSSASSASSIIGSAFKSWHEPANANTIASSSTFRLQPSSSQASTSLLNHQATATTATTASDQSTTIDTGIDQRLKKRQKVTADPTVRVAAGHVWQDPTLAEWPENDFRIFVGDLSVDVTDEMLTQCFAHLPSFAMARVVKNKKEKLGRGYGFVSFTDHDHGLRALKEMDGKYCFNRPMRLKKSSHEKRQAPTKLQSRFKHNQS